MSKTSNLKTLLVSLTTARIVDNQSKRVKFKAGQTVDLTDDELATLDKLAKSTGALQYRDPVNETAVAEDPAVVSQDQFLGEQVDMGDKSVDMLKAYLTFHSVEFGDDAKKVDLLKAANAHATKAADPDAGL